MGLKDSIIEWSASKEFYKECWKKDFKHYKPKPIDKKTLSWLTNFLEKDSVYQSYSEEEKKELTGLILEIDQKIPMVSETGAALSPYYRAYIASEAAKVVLRRSRSVVDIVSSIVVYGGVKLRKSFDEGGVCISKGFKKFYPSFVSYMDYLDTVVSTSIFNDVVGPKARDNINQLRLWKKNLKENLDKSKKNKFIALLRELSHNLTEEKPEIVSSFEKLLETIKGSGVDMTELLKAQGLDDTQMLEGMKNMSEVSDYIKQNTDNLIEHEEDLLAESECSIHISWLSHFTYLASNTPSNLIVHEFAHAIDFEYEGFDGIPSAESSSESKTVRKWKSLFEEAQEKFDFLNPYGFTNPYEFFAVVTEHYFRDPESLKNKGESLYNALKGIYGEDQGVFQKWSQIKTIKTIYFSKLGAAKIRL